MEDDLAGERDAYASNQALDYKYHGPFNRVDPCYEEVEEGRGIKVQLTQEEKVV